MEDGTCPHVHTVQHVTASADGCEDCLQTGGWWAHLRLCMTCGHVGCCDSSPNKHATAHNHATNHPIIRSFEPGEDWGFCYVDQAMLDGNWPVNGPIARAIAAKVARAWAPHGDIAAPLVSLTARPHHSTASSVGITHEEHPIDPGQRSTRWWLFIAMWLGALFWPLPRARGGLVGGG
jgi:hypothetical protein